MDGFWPTFQRRAPMPAVDGRGAAELPSQRLETTARVILPIQDQPGDPCAVLVAEGDSVRIGQKIGYIGTPPAGIAVHASIAGRVAAVQPQMHPLGQPVQSIVIEATGEAARVDPVPFAQHGSDAATFCREMGIPLDHDAIDACETLFVNATEDEPVLGSVERLLVEQTAACCRGLHVFAEQAGMRRIIVLVEKGRSALREAARELCADLPGAAISERAAPVPATAAQLLRIRRQTGGHSRKARLPSLMIGPVTLVALERAFEQGIPWIEQLITLCGSAVERPQNLWVPTGTPLDLILGHLGVDMEILGRVTMGGVMMGLPLTQTDVPVIKNARGIVASVALSFDEHHWSRFYRRSDCVRCGKCNDICPAGIPPFQLGALVEHRRFDEAVELGLFSCLECGRCFYVCPAMIPLPELIQLGKMRVSGTESLLIPASYRVYHGMTAKG